MARNIIYANNEAYQLGYNDGYNDGFYQGQKKKIDTGYNFAVEKACEWLREHVSVFGEAESDGWNATYKYDVEMFLKQFKQAMEE